MVITGTVSLENVGFRMNQRTVPVVSVRHFHQAEKRQSPCREEILLVFHWAVDKNITQMVDR